MGYLSCKFHSGVVEAHRREKAPPSIQIFRFEELESATRGFAVDMLLGKGSHGCVYKAVLSNGIQVAVKRPSYGRRMLEDEAAFDNEIKVLSKLNNPRLVRLLGFCHDSNRGKLLVVELMQNGNLHAMLHQRPEPMPWPKRVNVALQTARALCYIHSVSPPLIHRDIKSSNILIDSHGNAKLGDFGLALWFQASSTSIPPAGTLGYLDPEYTTPDMLSTKIDVFSFGILLLEIISGRNAIDINHNPPGIVEWAIPLIKSGQVQAVCDPRMSPPKNLSSLKQMALVAARCVRDRSSRRPEMADVLRKLQEISHMMGSSMINSMSCRMKQKSKSKQKVDLVEGLKASTLQHSDPSKKGVSRSLKVFAEERASNHGRRFKTNDTLDCCASVRQNSQLKYTNDASLKAEGICLTSFNSHMKGRLFDLFNEASLSPRRSNQMLPMNLPRMSQQCQKAVQSVGSSSGIKELKEAAIFPVH
ncbi:hypothetical protein KP509_15G035400 [Ceratopteris richardii]|uniref:Protein kinase domain-containing protein n=1 Tax=Ceratopteris richardii TaxID=49495 RepID=A0A8T2T636_CERRI|nr:hypothetical protein KP509_15G035400 [Ceratopteris richardii]